MSGAEEEGGSVVLAVAELAEGRMMHLHCQVLCALLDYSDVLLMQNIRGAPRGNKCSKIEQWTSSPSYVTISNFM